MKLAYLSLCGVAPHRIGGPENVASNILAQMDKKGVHVLALIGVLRHEADPSRLRQELGFSENIELYPVVKRHFDIDIGTQVLHDVARLPVLATGDGIDIVHYNQPPVYRDFSVPFAAKLRGIPQIYSYHGIAHYEYGVLSRKRPWLARYARTMFRLYRAFPAKVIVNNTWMVPHAIAEGFSPDDIEVIPNGVNVKSFERVEPLPLEGEPCLMFVGRLDEIKGVDIAIQAHKYLLRELPNAVLHIVGDGSMYRYLRELARELALGKSIIFHGFQRSSILPRFYAAADICIFPSRRDPFGLVLLEAMAAKRPVIVSPFGSVREILVNEQNGLICEPIPERLAETTLHLWEDKQLMKRISKNGLLTASGFDWSIIIERYIRLYESLL